ncbi:hypothetical protein [Rhodococcus qingshengii]|uniref:hypothetical protein n=1 Tax=Rhodococcus qingshengii TaxID=334542 RepID=UPI000815C253|nr:hypothetical protein [Rhodococcus qingshengii]SCC11167.1 hypothetical protein GA0061093_103432 [Rhodococcus qingshengii]
MTAPDPKRYQIVSLYDSRIIRRNLTHAEAWKFSRDLNDRTEHGAKIVEQR